MVTKRSWPGAIAVTNYQAQTEGSRPKSASWKRKLRKLLDLFNGAIIATAKATIVVCIYARMVATALIVVAIVGGAGFLALRALL